MDQAGQAEKDLIDPAVYDSPYFFVINPLEDFFPVVKGRIMGGDGVDKGCGRCIAFIAAIEEIGTEGFGCSVGL